VTRKESQYVLVEIMDNATDLPITEHATDIHGVTLANFALFDLVGLQFSPRIRGLGKIMMYQDRPKAEALAAWPRAGALPTRKVDADLISEHWDDLLRLAGSIKFGQATAAPVVGKLSAPSGQNTMAAALKEYGALPRTVYAARYLSSDRLPAADHEGSNEGLAAARARGRVGGRPSVATEELIRAARDMLPNPENSITTIAKLLGVSPGTLYNHIPDLRQLRAAGVSKQLGATAKQRPVPPAG
jgi:TnpA family transposase